MVLCHSVRLLSSKNPLSEQQTGWINLTNRLSRSSTVCKHGESCLKSKSVKTTRVWMRYYINVALLVVTLNKWGSLVQLDNLTLKVSGNVEWDQRGVFTLNSSHHREVTNIMTCRKHLNVSNERKSAALIKPFLPGMSSCSPSFTDRQFLIK